MEIEELKSALDERDDFICKKMAAVDTLDGSVIEMTDRLVEVEQKMAEIGQGAGVPGPTSGAFGRAVTESVQFKALLDGNGDKCRIEVKTAIVNATGQNQPLVPSDRLTGIVHGAQRRFHMRDLLASGTTTSSLVEYAKENVYTNNAGPQVANSPEEFENVTKPESAFTFTLATEAVSTLAHWVPVSKQVLSDSPALHTYLNNRLLYGLKLEEDREILLGTGANGELSGLYTNRTVYVMDSPLSYTTKLDVLRDAMAQVEASDYECDGIVLNSADWAEIQLAKDTTNQYIFGDPANSNGPHLWGVPVAVSNAMAAGTFLVGAFGQAAMLWDRESATVTLGWQGQDFVKNMISILVEERLAVTIFRAASMVGGSFSVA